MNDETKHPLSDQLKTLEGSISKLGQQVTQERDSVFEKFPILFLLFSSFGLVATFYGFEKIIDKIPYFVENPEMIFITGVVILFLSGALYKKLG